MLQNPAPRDELFSQLAKLGGSTPEAAAEMQPQPAAAPQQAEPETAPPAASDSPPEPETRRMRVLAAEDNKTNQLVFRKMVKELNIELKFASNGLEAVEAFQSFAPDLIFMDISMPMMDGKEATAEIRNIESGTGGHVPVVALTAHAMAGDSEGILAAGLDHYLTKPLRKALIHEKIHAFAPDDTQPLTPEDPAPAADQV